MDDSASVDLFMFDDDDGFRSSQESSCSVHFAEGENIPDEDLHSKIFNDPIHGHIELHPLLVKVVDTAQFQRLRNIKQLGANYFVYPGASHNRFEHCIGTCHLAGKLVRQLQRRQPDLSITEEDVLCVELAALAHDLGHGPFSHMFDLLFLPQARPNAEWKHEEASCSMLDLLIEENNLWPEFEKYNLKKTDVTFVKEMIAGPSSGINEANGWKFKGRPENKSFLYEIVSNERNKVDVDKWDYFARDCHHLGIKNSFDHNRFMRFCRVLTVEDELPQICARDKECFALYQMFHVRHTLHRVAYQHKCKTAIEAMICDAMCLANQHLKFRGRDGKDYSISDAIDDPVAYTRLTDDVFYQILNSTDDCDDMKKARSLIENILKRKLYSFVGKTRPNGKVYSGKHENCVKIQKEIAALDRDGVLKPDDLFVSIKNYNYGMKEKNPCDSFRFYSKHNPNKPYHIRREDVSQMLPGIFQDSEIQAYCKIPEKKELIKRCFLLWCSINKLKYPDNQSSNMPVLTPCKRPGPSSEKATKRRALNLE